jgi:hypothetical protein
MTFEQACFLAQRDSLHGYVRHVHRMSTGRYGVSDWYDSSVVASYEGGKLL